ncbi:DUF6588 family protein [Gangjinia marincola]
MKKLILLFSVLFAQGVNAQEIEGLLLAGTEDVNTLMQKYLNPAMKGVNYNLNNGWYTTAKTHKAWGFDITFTVNGSIISEEDKNFTFDENDYTFLTVDGGTQEYPTLLGGDASSVPIQVAIEAEGNQVQLAEILMPDGVAKDLPVSLVPSVMVQAGLGLPFNTNLKIRYVPNVGNDNNEGNLFGVALMHDIMQYFGPLDRLPLNVSVLGGFTRVNVDYNLQGVDLIPGSNQLGEFKINSWTVQGVASLDFPIITIYGGAGYGFGTSTFNMRGEYVLEYTEENSGQTITQTITDPLSLDFNAGGPSMTLGLRFNLGFFKLFGNYTLQEYQTFTTGMSFSFR